MPCSAFGGAIGAIHETPQDVLKRANAARRFRAGGVMNLTALILIAVFVAVFVLLAYLILRGAQ
jgi:hypothetical protein